MSSARHKLTSSQNLHHVRKSYQDETGPTGENIYWPIGRGTDGIVEDGDSYLISPNDFGEPECQIGVKTDWHDDQILKLGSAGNIQQWNYQMQANRPIITWDLSELVGQNLKIKSAICHIYAYYQLGANWNGPNVIVPHGAKVYSSAIHWDQQYASWCHYDEDSAWSSLGGGSWDNMDYNDVWTGANQTAEFECPDINGIATWFEIDFTSMVQTALGCANGYLNTLWVRDNDLTPTPIGDLQSGGDNNMIAFISGQNSSDSSGGGSSKHPYIVIEHIYCPDCPDVACP